MLDVKSLPNNVDTLKKIIDNLQIKYKKHEQNLKDEKFRYLILEEKFQVLQRKFFGRKSEKTNDEESKQLQLFNEAELYGNLDPKQSAQMEEEITVKSYSRKKKRKVSFPSHLPVKEEIYDVSEEDKKCNCCGDNRPCIGEEVRKELDIIPEQVRVIKHILKKYGPCNCEESKDEKLPKIITAKRPKRMLPGIIASVGLLAYLFVNKFLDSMPFNRQEKKFSRFGININRTNMCNWLIASSRKCQDLLDLMWKTIRAGPFIQMDETGMQVLKEPGRIPESKGYMFVTIGYDKSNKPITIYHYHRTRNKKIVAKVLEGFKGYFQTDGLKIYNDTENHKGITKVGCGAHIRRYFFDAQKLCKKKKGTPHTILEYFKEIYRIERKLRKDLEGKKLSKNEFVKKRKEQVKPILKEFHKLLLKERNDIPPKTKLGVGINYALKEWSKWIRYLEKWYITPDNNYVERKIRDYVIGRKNWYFADTLMGAHASSTMFTLIHTAKENGLNPYWYLRYLFSKLPQVETEEDLLKLLPTELKPKDIIMK